MFLGPEPALPGLRGPIGLRPESVLGGERARAMSIAHWALTALRDGGASLERQVLVSVCGTEASES